MKPIKNFKLDAFVTAINELMRADETLFALKLCDMLPGYYRDFEPKEISDLRRKIQSMLATSTFYARADDYELTASDTSYLQFDKTLRGLMLKNDIEMLNRAGLKPHVYDLAPGEYASVRMLLNFGLSFTYTPIWLNFPSYHGLKHHFSSVETKGPESDQPIVYFSGEIIEHLYCTDEIRIEMERTGHLADVIHVSTPLYTFDYDCENWESKKTIGHLRTFCPSEFTDTLAKMFRDYVLLVYHSQILHGRLVRKDTRFKEILETAGKDVLGSALTKG